MKTNNRTYKSYIGIAVGILLLVACHRGPKMIPEDTMRSIMREALISQSIVQNVNTDDPKMRPLDSLNVQSPILRKHGYTLDDLRFTIREMSMRKSNPLANILSGVASDIKVSSKAAEVRYKIQLGIDSVAQSRTADTVYMSDTVLRRRLDGYKFTYTGRIPKDSTVLPGTYKIEFEYSTGAHARAYTKSVRYKRFSTNGSSTESTIWLPVAKDTILFSGDIPVRAEVKQLDISLNETKPAAGQAPDTSYLKGIRLVRILPVKEARTLYYHQLTGLDPLPLEQLYEKRYYDTLQKYLSPIPPLTGR